MSLTVDFAADKTTMVVITDHGLEVQITDLLQLHNMLRAQERPKMVGISSDNAHIVLAAWERVGPDGAGKVPKPPLAGELAKLITSDYARQYDKRGRLIRLSAADPIPDLQ